MTNVSKDARIMSEEPFGPLAPISSFSDMDEVIEEANRLDYGLAPMLILIQLKLLKI